jgi:hypothetical protein
LWGGCQQSPSNIATWLKAKIMEGMTNLPRATVAKACKRFRPHIEAMMKASGDFFK